MYYVTIRERFDNSFPGNRDMTIGTAAGFCALLSAAVVLTASAEVTAQRFTVESVENRSPDGRFGTRCYPWSGDTSRDLCEVSFYRLIATPERYDGQLIALTGFLISVFDDPTLFASRDAYTANVQVDGVFVDGEIPRDMRSRLKNGVYPILVVGVFDAKYSGRSLPALGALRKIERIAPAVPPPTGIPAGP
jgi:hypothetical protein